MDDKHFDEIAAKDWISVIEAPGASIREIDFYPLLRDWLKNSVAENVLDIGCGQGICSANLGEVESAYTGVDPSPYLISRAKDLYSKDRRTFVMGDAYALPFANAQFGAAFSIAVWHLLKDIKTASHELSRVLKPGGHFLIVTADPGQYASWTGRYTEKKFAGSVFTGTNIGGNGEQLVDTLHLHKLVTIIDELKLAGLVPSNIETIRTFVAIKGQKNA